MTALVITNKVCPSLTQLWTPKGQIPRLIYLTSQPESLAMYAKGTQKVTIHWKKNRRGTWYVYVYSQSTSCVWLFVTPWTVAHQAPLSMGYCRQEYWSRLPFSSPQDLPNPGIKPESLKSPELAGRFFTTSSTINNKHTWNVSKISITKYFMPTTWGKY